MFGFILILICWTRVDSFPLNPSEFRGIQSVEKPHSWEHIVIIYVGMVIVRLCGMKYLGKFFFFS